MKELNDHSPDKVKITNQRQVEHGKLMQQWKHHPGHKVWELDLTDKMIREAKIDQVNVEVTKLGEKIHRKVTQRPNCLYVSALNAKNADKKFIQMLMVHEITSKLK